MPVSSALRQPWKRELGREAALALAAWAPNLEMLLLPLDSVPQGRDGGSRGGLWCPASAGSHRAGRSSPGRALGSRCGQP